MSSRSPIGRAVVALATLLVAGGTVVLDLGHAEPAAAASSCVAVVVDSRQLGGSVATGCAQGDPATGLQALTRAGFAYTPRPRDGLICQINAHPACTDTTSTTYWSYWYRAAGSSHWVYATEGSATHNPKPGSTEGWVWQTGGRTPPPSIRADAICPQQATTPAQTTTPTPTHPSPSGPASHRTGTTPSGRPSPRVTTAHAGSTRRPAAATATPASRPTGSPAATDSPAASPTTSQPATQAGPTTASAAGHGAGPGDQGGGGALGGTAGVVLGGVVVLGIGTATVIRARRGSS